MTNELNMLNTYLNNQVVIEEIPASAGMTANILTNLYLIKGRGIN